MKQVLKTVTAICLMIGAISCGTQKTATGVASVMDLSGQWDVISLNDKAVEATEKTPVMSFDIKEQRLHGNTGCNIMNGQLDIVSLAQGEINLSRLATTRMACMEPNLEYEFLTTTQEVKTYTINNKGLLLLQNADNKAVVILKKRK